jgi:hypothetical protein
VIIFLRIYLQIYTSFHNYGSPEVNRKTLNAPALGTKNLPRKERLVPLTGQFSNLLMEGLERIWEVHKFLPDPKSIRRIIDIS